LRKYNFTVYNGMI